MAGRVCPNCGAALEFSGQKFCSACGTQVPDAPQPLAGSSPVGGAGFPVVALAVIALVVLGAGAFVLLPYVMPGHGASSAGDGSSPDTQGLRPTPVMTDLPGVTTIPATTTIESAQKTTTITTTIHPTTTATTAPATTTPSPPATATQTPVTTTTIPTPEPTPEPTSVITLSETQVPPQPPSSSYTSSTPGAPYIDPFALESRIHQLINVQREQNGRAALSQDPFLADIARGHSWDMVQRNFFEHMNPDGKLARDRGVDAGYPCTRVVKGGSYNGISENIMRGYRADATLTDQYGNVTYEWRTLDQFAQIAVDGWMASPGHRENILTARFELEGIGVAFGPDDTIYVTQNFC
ncbi:MAG: zinc-ribbon domain-containing protein [Methanomicrobiales archaeon]|nr:zinc-ribbon domain-containing protein [Methanomicrobiales archaeon]